MSSRLLVSRSAEVASMVGASTMNAIRYLPFAGRLLIGAPFLVSGLSKLSAYGATIDVIAASNLPLPPPLAYAGAVILELGCGVLIIAGYQARIVAAALALYCLATAVFFHNNLADQNQIFHFFKNLIMTGGLLQIVGFGAGAVSIDDRLSKGRARAENVAVAS
jgi:putative oxidoreductase